MKTITNFLLVLTLTASMALADGHTGTGNRCDTCPPPCTEGCALTEQEPPVLAPDGEPSNEENLDESLYEYWKGVLTELFY